MKTSIVKFVAAYLILFLSILVPAQTGGNFTITESVIAGGGGQTSTGGTFSLDGTIGQPAAGGALEGSPFAVTSGFWNFAAAAPPAVTFESDVAGRPHGDTSIQSNDVVQVQRFQIGLEQPNQSNEFQRADSAPFTSRGDSLIQSNDVVQAQRYQIGLDIKQNANGPTAPAAMRLPEEAAAEAAKPYSENQAGAAPREVRVESVTSSAGQTVVVNILVDALGDESGYGFQLNFNQMILTNPSVMIGTAGGSRFCNTTTVAGQITCSVNNFPNNNPTSSTDQIGEIAAGNNQLLVKVTFTVATGASAGVVPVTISNVNASNDAAQNLTPITATSGTVTIAGPTAASVSAGGRVTTAGGRGIRNAQITITDSKGISQTIRTGAFGYYRFEDITAGENYIFIISAKRFTFRQNAQAVFIIEERNDINFVADE
ncbi:MAG: carboxypeptidase regulatory-like domain-containing protein [Acidobacteriota bacterium]|nr:carboxypeptidase regulatory-like domain-containing protein [Acidobacteriota bacterium]